MTSSMLPRVFFSSFALGALALACSSTSSTVNNSSGGGGSSGSSGDPVVSTQDCTSACESKATGCGAPAATATARCADVCGNQPTQGQLACLADKSCADLAKLDSAAQFDALCAKGSSPPAPDGGTSTPKDSGSTACIALGKTGCSSLNAPSGCCTDAKHPTVVCNGNNDGNGNAQCCVNSEKPCVDVADCCGYAGASAQVKALYKCAAGVCSF
jgi:hypothetical protein